MFGFGNTEEDIELQVMRPHRIRSSIVYPTTQQITAAEKLFKNIPGSDDQSVLTDVFSKFPYPDGGDPTSLYNIFYLTELKISEWEKEIIEPLKKRLNELRADAENDKKNPKKHDEAIAEVEKNIKRNRYYAIEKRRRLYEGFFEYLHEQHGDNVKEVDRIIHGITDWHVSGSDNDNAHARMVINLRAFRKSYDKNEAYGNPWYMLAMGTGVMILGAAFFIASLITGFAAPYIFVFAAIGLGGLFMTFMSGKKTANELLTHRLNMDVDADLRTPASVEENKQFQKSQSSMFNSITWSTAPLYLLAAGALVLLMVDAYLGGPLSVIGSALKFDIIPYYKLGVDFSNTKYWQFPLAELVINSLGAIISSSSINFMVLGAITWLGAELLSYATALSNNKTFLRVHSIIRQFADTVKWTYSICGGASLFFGFESMLSLPMLGMGLAGVALLFCGYKYFVKGEKELVIPANPGIGGYLAAPEKKLSYSTLMGYSAGIILMCSLSLFVFPASPIAFGVLMIVGAAIYTIAQDQMKAIAARREAKENQEMIRLDMHNPSTHTLGPSPVKAAQPQASASATAAPVLTKPAPAVSVKNSPTQKANRS